MGCLKSCLRGTFIVDIAAIKYNSSALLIRVEDQVRQLELAYVMVPSESAREAWISGQDSLGPLRSSAPERKWFFTKQAFYEEGEKNGCLLARIARSQQPSSAIGEIRSSLGLLVNDPELIITEIASFYADLYKPCNNYTDKALQNYLSTISMSALTHQARMELEAPLTMDELKEAAASFPTCKALEDDGIPMEVYTEYGEVILPKLLEVFNSSFKSGQLPITMTRAKHNTTT